MIEKLSPDFVFKFTEADLVENREGHLSASQVRHLRAEGFRIAAIIVGAVLLVTFLGIASAPDATADEAQFVGLIMFGIIAFTVWHYILRTERAIRDRRVTALTGELAILPILRANRIMIAGQMFNLTRDESRSVLSGNDYTLYLIEPLHKIVALETYIGGTRTQPKAAPLIIDQFELGRETLRA